MTNSNVRFSENCLFAERLGFIIVTLGIIKKLIYKILILGLAEISSIIKCAMHLKGSGFRDFGRYCLL